MSYNSINKVDINGVEYILHDLTDGTYVVEIPALTKDETFAIQSKVNADLYKKVDKVSGKELSTNDFTNEYKNKLDGIEDNANKYIHPSYTAYAPGFYKVTVDDKGHVSSAVKVEKSDITALGIPGQDTTYVDMVGATSSTTGKNGLVPAPSKGDATRYLRSDGTWVVPPDTTYPLATTSDKGLMSKEDKDKLDKIEASANNYSLPTATGTELGGVKIGDNVSISNSTISVANASISTKGVVQLSSSIESNSETTAATSKAVKLINDKVNSLDTTTNAALPKSGGTMTGAIDMGNNKITDVPSPTNDTDVANKQYVDSVVPNLNVAVDSELSTTSTNPVQNKIITESLNNKLNVNGKADAAVKADGVADYNASTKTIKIGYQGDGIAASDLKYLAGYNTNGNIKDITWDAVNSTILPNKSLGVVDYTNSDKVIKVGWAADAVGISDIKHIAVYTNNGNIKDATEAGVLSLLGISSGTWTPTVSGAASYTLQTGRYIKVGDMAIVSFSIYGTFSGDTTAQIKVSGCPLTPADNMASGGGHLSGYTAAANIVFTGWNTNINGNFYAVGQETGTTGTNKWGSTAIYQKASGDFSASGTLMFAVT